MRPETPPAGHRHSGRQGSDPTPAAVPGGSKPAGGGVGQDLLTLYQRVGILVLVEEESGA
jgi:hypothetical protein